MDLFDNFNQEEFLLFVRNFNMNLAASGTLVTGAKTQYLCTLVRGEALIKFDLLYADVEGANPKTVETIILGLAFYFYPVNFMSKKIAQCAAEWGIHTV